MCYDGHVKHAIIFGWVDRGDQCATFGKFMDRQDFYWARRNGNNDFILNNKPNNQFRILL